MIRLIVAVVWGRWITLVYLPLKRGLTKPASYDWTWMKLMTALELCLESKWCSSTTSATMPCYQSQTNPVFLAPFSCIISFFLASNTLLWYRISYQHHHQIEWMRLSEFLLTLWFIIKNNLFNIITRW